MNSIAQVAFFSVFICVLYVAGSAAVGFYHAFMSQLENEKLKAQEREMRKMIRTLIAEHREAELVLAPDYREPGED
jgi:Tfp pilus assembly protein PilO